MSDIEKPAAPASEPEPSGILNASEASRVIRDSNRANRKLTGLLFFIYLVYTQFGHCFDPEVLAFNKVRLPWKQHFDAGLDEVNKFRASTDAQPTLVASSAPRIRSQILPKFQAALLVLKDFKTTDPKVIRKMRPLLDITETTVDYWNKCATYIETGDSESLERATNAYEDTIKTYAGRATE